MLIKVQRGLDLRLGGEPAAVVERGADVRSVALCAPDYMSLRPAIVVAEGDRVVVGQRLLYDKSTPDVSFTAPGTGRVRAINRGGKRKLLSIVIDIDDDATRVETDFPTHDPVDTADTEAIKRTLLESGLWVALRGRPYGAVADPKTAPRAIFVNAMQTDPLGADPTLVLEPHARDFEHGVAYLSALCTQTLVCKSPSLEFDHTRIGHARVVDFLGPHPAGLSGTHIHALAAVGEQPDLWYVGYQDVVAIGRLLATGVLDLGRVIAIGGPCAKRPRLVETRIGASLDDLLVDELRFDESEADVRIVSGSPLSGRAVGAQTAYLGRYDTQVALLRERASRHARAGGGSTGLNGWPSGMLSLETFERAWPFDVPPIPLLRALLAHDVDTAHALGCLGFEEEDLALCSYSCPAKYDYGKALRATLETLRSEQ